MILACLIALPLLAGLLAFGVGLRAGQRPGRATLVRIICLAALLVDGLLLAYAWGRPRPAGPWLREASYSWLPRFGISFHLGLDGLSALLVALTLLLGVMALVASWTEIDRRVGFFHLNLMATLGGIVGVFLAVDLFLFVFFWELMLVPMVLLIGLFGHERRRPAALKFLLFTQAGGLALLVAVVGLYLVHLRATGVASFDLAVLLGTPMSRGMSFVLFAGFSLAFAVKLPVVPLHSWLPDAHTEAPTGGSVILAGVLLKTGAYGFIRFAVPLFPEAARAAAPGAMVLGVVGILYGAWLAFAQRDLKRLVAYSSVSHLGFVLLGVFVGNTVALEGAVMQMLSHGVSAAALFMLVGALEERIHSRDLARMGGFWSAVPRLGAVLLFFAIATLGLPGLGNFVGEILVLAGSYRRSLPLTAVAALGLVLATVYALQAVQRTLHGPLPHEGPPRRDLGRRELLALGLLAGLSLGLGLYPQPVVGAAGPGLVPAQLGQPAAADGARPSGRPRP